jgi:hypothetical protein
MCTAVCCFLMHEFALPTVTGARAAARGLACDLERDTKQGGSSLEGL